MVARGLQCNRSRFDPRTHQPLDPAYCSCRHASDALVGLARAGRGGGGGHADDGVECRLAAPRCHEPVSQPAAHATRQSSSVVAALSAPVYGQQSPRDASFADCTQ
eukprot:6188584-Pleurochrysis_carterae.AAC.2